jgi:hypothetical protein
MQRRNGRKLASRPILNLRLVIKMEDFSELALASLCQIGQAAHHKVLDIASLQVDVRLVFLDSL